LFCSFLLTIVLVGQTGLVRGTVADSASGVAVSGANVMLVGTGVGASTGDNGGFVLGPVKAGACSRRVTSPLSLKPSLWMYRPMAWRGYRSDSGPK